MAPAMRRQTAVSWGVLALLFALLLFAVGDYVASYGTCLNVVPAAYCVDSGGFTAFSGDVFIVAGMTVVLSLVVLVLSRDIPAVPREALSAPRPVETADFEDL